jgi:hypothetical protein
MSDNILTAVFEETKNITLKSFGSLIILLLTDGIFGFLFSIFFPEKIKPLELTYMLFSIIKSMSSSFGVFFTFLSIYLLIWGWGLLIFALRQSLLLDFLKNDYSDHAFDKKAYRKLRDIVVEKIKNRYKEKIDGFLEYIQNNDYFLYIILSRKFKENKTSEADYIAFEALNLIIISSFVYLFYLYKTFIPEYICINPVGIIKAVSCPVIIFLSFEIVITLLELLNTKFSPQFLYFIRGFYVSLAFSLFISHFFCEDVFYAVLFFSLSVFVSLTIWWIISLKLVAGRLVSRNIRLYINFLMEEHNGKNTENRS